MKTRRGLKTGKRRMKGLHALRLEPRDVEFAELLLICEKALQSGWGSWSISKHRNGKTFVRTDTLGRRQVNSPYEEVEERLLKFEEELKKKGLIAGSAEAETEIEKWLDKEFPTEAETGDN